LRRKRNDEGEHGDVWEGGSVGGTEVGGAEGGGNVILREANKDKESRRRGRGC